ncbi:MAG: PD40 domain-containing protein, partial [Muribaculaceae bacterium]|nr:PD40 domain-containing protein [Muribaculaceae bacterium]
MKTKALILVAALAATALTGRAEEGRLLRFPATNGTDVAFSYAGDIYSVSIHGGTARRLTSHNGYEAFSRFSPDGRTLAFTGQYDGNTEVYLMPIEGGEPRRITFTASNPRDDWGDRMGPNNIVMTWTPDGGSVVFRNRISDSFDGKLWMAPIDGSMPTQLPLPEGGFCSYSPDGKKLAYNRVFREFRTWKYYRGGMADDVWIYDMASKTVKNITNNVAQDIVPMWIGDEIYYISDRDMTMNIFVYNTVTGQTSKVTNFTDYDVKFPSCGGGMIVFEKGGYLYTLDPKTKQTAQIRVEMNSENSFAREELKSLKDYVTAASISPDGNRLTISARGEVLDVPVKHGVTRNITHTPGVHERDAQWSPDGKNIAYISDQTGETELWMRPADGGDPIQLTRDNDTYIRDFNWSPKGDRIVYTDRENRIVMVNVAARSREVLLQDSVGEFPTPRFSPDGRWLTYYQQTPNENNVVYLYNIAQRKATAVTDNWFDSNAPAFSSDGKYLIFASGRDFNPIYSNIEWNFAYGSMEGIYLVMLSKDTPSPFVPTDDKVKVETEEQSGDRNADKKKDKKEAKGDDAIKIDLEGITDRIVKVPVATGSYGSFACDGNHLWYYGNGGTHVYDFKEQKDVLIASQAMMQPSADMKKAIFFKKGDIYVTALPTGKVELDEAVNLDDMTAMVNYDLEWKQIFNEAWRAYRDGFYLKTMHGVDWNAIHDKYAALLPYVKNRLDLTYVIGGMIGELACGHAYVDGGDHIEAKQQKIGMLGAELAREGDAFRITKILKGAPDRSQLRSPLTEQGMNIKEGDYITAVDGVSTRGVSNIYTLLRGKANVMTELTIASSASGTGARKVVVKPIQSEYELYHHEWVQHNIDYVNQKTGGRVGYIYIPDMGPEGLREFSRYYFAQTDKEAVIVDDRGNGGGNISPMVIERLLRQPYRLTMFRGSSFNGTIPEKTIYGPKVLLVNKYSASDGDLFPWSF